MYSQHFAIFGEGDGHYYYVTLHKRTSRQGVILQLKINKLTQVSVRLTKVTWNDRFIYL